MHLERNVRLGRPLSFLLFGAPRASLACFRAELWRLLQDLRSPGCSEVLGARAEQLDFYFPQGALCCSPGVPLAGGGRKLTTLQPLMDIHREPSTRRRKAGRGAGRNRSKCIWPRGVEMSFTGGGEGLRRAKPVSCLPASRGWRPQLSHLPHAQLRPAGASFSQKASSSAGLGTLRSPSTRQKKKKKSIKLSHSAQRSLLQGTVQKFSF